MNFLPLELAPNNFVQVREDHYQSFTIDYCVRRVANRDELLAEGLAQGWITN